MFKKLFKKQLAIVVEWKNQNPNDLFYKVAIPTDEIKNASKLIINPGQGCILVYQGKIKETLLEAGTYQLETDNHPFITSLLKLRQSFESEHKLNLYFFRKAELISQKWGTSTPIKYTDPIYQFPIELGTYGTFSLKIAAAQAFFENFVGNKDIYSIKDIQQLLTTRITPEISSHLAKQSYSYQQIDAHLTELSSELKNNLNHTFEQLGLQLTDFRIEATSFSQETEARIKKIADMTAEARSASEVGLDYAELERIRALRDAAKNSNGLAGAGLQLGAGLELGKTLQQNQATATPTANNNDDPVAQLKKLKQLLDEGILTQQEFDTKKQQILSKM